VDCGLFSLGGAILVSERICMAISVTIMAPTVLLKLLGKGKRSLFGLREEVLDGILLVNVPLSGGPLEPLHVVHQTEDLSTLEAAQRLVLLEVVPEDFVVTRSSSTCSHTNTHVD